jgi:hypothetical protein
MKKAEFIKKVSKIEDTFEDEFRAEFNSPELIWEAVIKQLILSGVSNWVAIESEEQPERVTDVMVKYKDNRKEVAFFDGDGRFYTQNDDDITDKIASWHKLP